MGPVSNSYHKSRRAALGWGEEMSLTINSEVENLGKFCSSSEAGSSPVLPTVLRSQALNPQRPHVWYVDPLLVLSWRLTQVGVSSPRRTRSRTL